MAHPHHLYSAVELHGASNSRVVSSFHLISLHFSIAHLLEFG